VTLNARVTASSDLSGKHTLRPIADGMVYWDLLWPLDTSLEWHRLNGRCFDTSRYRKSGDAPKYLHTLAGDLKQRINSEPAPNYFADSIPFAYPSQTAWGAMEKAYKDALSDSKIEVEEPMRNANLYETIDGNCCTGCGGKGFNWLEARVSDNSIIRPIELCRECGGCGFYRQTHNIPVILAAFAIVVALIVFTLIPLYRIYFL
jgi:hypothetical protein